MKKFLAIIGTIIVWCPTAYCQTQLRILDEVSGMPVPYASIIFGNDMGRYSDESGTVLLPDGIASFEISHISYEPKNVSTNDITDNTVLLRPLIYELQPAIVVPGKYRKGSTGFASDKGARCEGGRNGYSIAEYFAYNVEWTNIPLITGIEMNLNSVWMQRQATVTLADGTTYDDGKMIMAKLRVDLRAVDSMTGAPGRSLIRGGIIYDLGERLNLNVRKVHTVPIEYPLPFPEDGVFVVLEWIVPGEVRIQDTVTPSIWCSKPNGKKDSWNKWPVGYDWKKTHNNQEGNSCYSYCISLEMFL